MIPPYFAADWETGWNSHDLDQIMAHYRTDIVFRSAKARALVGTGVLPCHAALRAYWDRALAAQPTLKFEVQDVLGGHDTLVIIYDNHCGVRAAETLTFDAHGLVICASACHQTA